MANELKYQGIGISGQTLILYVSVEVGTTVRFREVRVPISDVTSDEVMYEIYKAAAKRLRVTWESDPPPWEVDRPLPGIG